MFIGGRLGGAVRDATKARTQRRTTKATSTSSTRGLARNRVMASIGEEILARQSAKVLRGGRLNICQTTIRRYVPRRFTISSIFQTRSLTPATGGAGDTARQVEARHFLGQLGGREVDGDPSTRDEAALVAPDWSLNLLFVKVPERKGLYRGRPAYRGASGTARRSRPRTVAR
jgi:hypothetical protein